MEELLRIMPTAKGPNAPPFETGDIPTSDAWQTDVIESSDMTYSMMVHKRMSQVTQMLNVRKQTWGYECRSGYKTYTLSTPVPSQRVPVAKTAYLLKEVGVDVTFYQDGTTIGALCLLTNGGQIVDLPSLVTGLSGSPLVTAAQFQTFVMFSVQGYGTWRMSPAALDCLTWNAPQLLGKDVCPTPSTKRFAETTTGDLLIWDGGNVPQTEGNKDVLQDNLFHDPGAKRPRTIRLPIKATYFRVADSITVNGITQNLQDATGYPSYEINGKDLDPATPPFHLPSRAYGYRFVMVHKYTDVLLQEFTYRSAPSTDWWIPAMHYMPAQIFPVYGDTTVRNTDSSFVKVPPFWFGPSNGPNQLPGNQPYTNGVNFNVFTDKNCTGNGYADFLPQTMANPVNHGVGDATDGIEFFALAKKYRDLVNNEGFRPYSFASYYFGMRSSPEGSDPDANLSQDPDGRDMQIGPTYGIQPFVPYMTSWEIRRTPLTKFQWSDFTVPSDVVEIEVYRTAYSAPSDADNISTSPLFAPHKYGYVGSIKPNADFLDDVTDDSLDFENENPEKHDGYLAGEFSGAVSRIHGDSFSTVVLGDIITHYHLLSPVVESAFIAATPAGASDGFSYTNDLAPVAADGLKITEFYLQYIDNSGKVSAINRAPVSLALPSTSGPTPIGDSVYVWITPPRGYEPSITGINIIRGVYAAGVRTFDIMTTLNPTSDSVYCAKKIAVGATPSASFSDSPAGTPTHSPGAITWSNAYDSMAWPKDNFEVHHQFAPIVGMSSVLGPMYVYTAISVTKTDLAGRFELDSDKLGCISRWAITKYEKVDLFLSKDGLCLSEGSSQRLVRGSIQSEILKYLRENIPGQPALANARRASLALLGRGRGEVWLRFPSSVDLGGSLPARIFIYREFEFTGLQQVYNYEFQLSGNEGDPQGIALFAEHGDGRLFSAHLSNIGIIIQDNDTDAAWTGVTALEIKCPFRELTITKLLDSIWWWAEIHASFSIATGTPDQSGVRDIARGILAKTVRVFPVTVLGSGYEQGFKHDCNGPSVERRSRHPYIRFTSAPDPNGLHSWGIRAIRATYTMIQ